MTASELIAQLQDLPPNTRIFMGYDGNVVVERADKVLLCETEGDIYRCWYAMDPGDAVILCRR